MNTTLRERMDKFIADLEMFDTWQEKFTYIMEHQPAGETKLPACLHLEDRLPNCRSNTYFHAEPAPSDSGSDRVLICAGWSNSPILSGLITIITDIFSGTPVGELAGAEIDFHTRSGLTDNLTPIRKQAVEEIIRRIENQL